MTMAREGFSNVLHCRVAHNSYQIYERQKEFKYAIGIKEFTRQLINSEGRVLKWVV